MHPLRSARHVLPALLALALPVAHAGTLPLVQTLPPCAHARLGTVEAATGTDISQGRGLKARKLPPADYAVVLESLSRAGARRGANALVLRDHQAMFLTKKGVRSPAPVRVSVRAAAVRIDDPAACALPSLDAAMLRQRAFDGEAEDIAIEFDSVDRPQSRRPNGLRSRVLP